MSGYKSAMAAQGYVAAHARRDNCASCAVVERSTGGFGGVSLRCPIGGFFPDAHARCGLYRPAAGLPQRVSRPGDMGTEECLTVSLQPDGDVIVRVDNLDGRDRIVSVAVEFCAPGTGGGRSPHTRLALLDLIAAMARDQKERPL